MIAPERELYLAVSSEIYQSIFGRKSVEFIVRRYRLKLMVIQLDAEVIVQWIN